MKEYKIKFIELLVRSGCLRFGDFVAKSGRKTPYFINTGNIMYGDQLSLVGDIYAQTYIENIGNNANILFGPAYKGIPLISVTAASLYTRYGLKTPICFNRKEKKDHGEGGVLVGKKPEENDHIVIIEDVITAGTSIRESIDLLSTISNISIDGLIIAVDRMEKGFGEESTLFELQNEFGINVYPILNIKEIVEYLYKNQVDGTFYIDDDIMEKIEQYQKRYCLV